MADITGIEEVHAAFKKLQRTTGANVQRALRKCGKWAMTEAKLNAPKSPDMKHHSATLKRKQRTKDKKTPGGLERSIFFEVMPYGLTDYVASVFVPSNSDAKEYARYIHDGKGSRWFKRGPGTEHKGARADDKFIERAIRDNTGKFTDIFEDEIRKAVASV